MERHCSSPRHSVSIIANPVDAHWRVQFVEEGPVDRVSAPLYIGIRLSCSCNVTNLVGSQANPRFRVPITIILQVQTRGSWTLSFRSTLCIFSFLFKSESFDITVDRYLHMRSHPMAFCRLVHVFTSLIRGLQHKPQLVLLVS